MKLQTANEGPIFYIHISVSHLYIRIPKIGQPILLQPNRQTLILRIYKSLIKT
jgi:hypothetical protein